MRTIFVLIALACAMPGNAKPVPRPSQGELIRAIHATGALWMLDDGGWLSRLADGATRTQRVAMAGTLFDLCRINGEPAVAMRVGGQFVVRQPAGAGWRTTGSMTVEQGERPIGLACNGPTAVLLSDRQVMTIGGTVRRLASRIGGRTPHPFRYVLYHDGQTVLVGSNAGEWGGDLTRIALADGSVTGIETARSPVHDIAAEVGKPGCVILAIGLVHFVPNGELDELCGNTARRLFVAPFGDQPSKPIAPGATPYPSVAFFALAPQADGLVAIGVDSMRRVSSAGVEAPRPLPPFVERGGVHLSEASPDYLLVLTGVNGRGAISGAMPLVVPRR